MYIFTCLEFSRICLRAISNSSLCRSTSNGFTIESDGFERFSGRKSSYEFIFICQRQGKKGKKKLKKKQLK